jgi:hypothetical protein
MPVLKPLSFTALPKNANDPIQMRRTKFIARLEVDPGQILHNLADIAGWPVADLGQPGARTTGSYQPDAGLTTGANRSENVAALASLAATSDAEIRP